MKKFQIIIILLFVLIFSSIVFAAESVEELEQQQAEVDQQAAEAQQHAAEAEQMAADVEKEIEEINAQLEQLNTEYQQIQEELGVVTIEYNQTLAELEEAQAKKEEQLAILEERVAYYYKHGKTGYVELLFSAENLTDLMLKKEYVVRIIEYDKALLADLEETEALINEKFLEVEAQKQELDALNAECEQKQAELQQLLADKNALLAQYNDEAAQAQADYEQLAAESQQIEEDIKKAQQNAGIANPYSGGVMTWPCPGYYSITSDYGYRSHPISGSSDFHEGVDIDGPYGADIVAAYEGEVIFAGYKNGYGNYVVIDHGNGYSTCYAHCQDIYVTEGEYVQQGQTIASVGSTGNSTGSHLHFEVRINGATVNPMSYL